MTTPARNGHGTRSSTSSTTGGYPPPPIPPAPPVRSPPPPPPGTYPGSCGLYGIVARSSFTSFTAVSTRSGSPVMTTSSVSRTIRMSAPDSSFIRLMFTPCGPTISPPLRGTWTLSTTPPGPGTPREPCAPPCCAMIASTIARAASTLARSKPPMVHVPAPFCTLTLAPDRASMSRIVPPPEPMTRPSMCPPMSTTSVMYPGASAAPGPDPSAAASGAQSRSIAILAR
mmetsp:Transcript_3100/g.10312  ORF Transcript_3100/g.10312 Transcript_3100/m.10312 type:complete len:228 (-) Transcript_3100:255-938(-)